MMQCDVHVLVDSSSSGPSSKLEEALWDFTDSIDETTLLWHDPEIKPWQRETAYIFDVEFKPSHQFTFTTHPELVAKLVCLPLDKEMSFGLDLK